MPIPVTCECGRTFKLSDALAGRRIRCTACGHTFAVPPLETEPDVEDAALDVLFTEEPGAESESPPVKPANLDLSDPLERPPPPPTKPKKPKPKPRQEQEQPAGPRIAFEEGWFGNVNAGAAGGILMMLIAVVWFVVGLANNWIAFYPPILFLIGFAALMKAISGGNSAP